MSGTEGAASSYSRVYSGRNPRACVVHRTTTTLSFLNLCVVFKIIAQRRRVGRTLTSLQESENRQQMPRNGRPVVDVRTLPPNDLTLAPAHRRCVLPSPHSLTLPHAPAATLTMRMDTNDICGNEGSYRFEPHSP